MYKFITPIRVRYAETDQMGVVYYGNYPQYFEVGRVEALRNLGTTYRSLEERGIMLPVLSLHIKYIRPATYDESIEVVTLIKEKPGTRISFDHEIYNQKGVLLTKGNVELVFVDAKTRRPMQAPDDFVALFEEYFGTKD